MIGEKGDGVKQRIRLCMFDGQVRGGVFVVGCGLVIAGAIDLI